MPVVENVLSRSMYAMRFFFVLYGMSSSTTEESNFWLIYKFIYTSRDVGSEKSITYHLEENPPNVAVIL